jgi:glycosyltransferase involved in cell wall biosynthesis
MSPRFSVIIPAYNAAATLARAIESVRAQTWPAHEIIIVDDGSSDDTASIARSYGDAVKLIRQPNSGVAVARNVGARSATGEWLAFLDADDWYAPDRIRLHAEWIAEDNTLDFLTGDYEYRDDTGNLLGTSMAQHEAGRLMLAKAQSSPRVVMDDRPEEIEAFVTDHFGDTHTLSVPRQTFLELGGYPPGFKVCEDVHFLTRLVARSSRIGVICQNLGVYVIHGASATRKNPVAAQQENVRTLEDLATLAEGFSPAVRQGVAVRIDHARYNLGCALSKTGHRVEAIQAVLPSLVERPGWQSLRNVLSMIKG